MDKISERIYNVIKNANLSYGEVSQLTGIPKSALHRYATGETEKCPLSRLVAIAQVTGVSPAYLMGWEKVDQKSETLISHSEEKLLKNVRKLNTTGRKKADEYITDLLENPKYTESSLLSEISKDIAQELESLTGTAKKNITSK
ncbi:MAG: helix-turn-helix domain-containing protein [Oscillospiraceae bacterium]|nr:helix-turn-helix domain-containing protein [Oscillospiraceae bacterium]